MSAGDDAWLKTYLEDKFKTQKEDRQNDKTEVKNHITNEINRHKQECEGYLLAINLSKAVKIGRMIYVALPVSIILTILGFVRAFLHF